MVSNLVKNWEKEASYKVRHVSQRSYSGKKWINE
jgi:hypothetical protein